ncbi:TrmH family RNA methyltransferase [Candidatus Dependentiae bacterium]
MIKKAKKEKAKQVGELIFGIHPLIELLKAKRRKIISIYTTKPEPKAWQKIKELMPKYPVPIQYVKRDILTRLAGTTDHQGFVAWTQKFPFRKKFFDPKKQKFLVMLDGIQDPRNLGAILRSAYCTGVSGAILTQKGSAPLNAVAIKASAGLSEHMEICIAPSAQSAAQQLKEAGYNMYISVFDGQDATTCEFKEPLCMVVGSEGLGVSKNIIKYGTPVTLAQRTSDISYNASVAAGILLFLVGTKNKVI